MDSSSSSACVHLVVPFNPWESGWTGGRGKHKQHGTVLRAQASSTTRVSLFLRPLCLVTSPRLIISWWRKLWSRRGIWSRGSPQSTRCFWPSGIGRWRRARWAQPGSHWRNSGYSSAWDTTNETNQQLQTADFDFRFCPGEDVKCEKNNLLWTHKQISSLLTQMFHF